MKYFWCSQFDIPEGSGYPLFGWQHILCLILIACLITAFCMIFSKQHDLVRKNVLRSIPVLLLILELWKDLLLVTEHRFSIGFLPLHLCSMGIPLFFIQAYCRSEKWRSITGEICFCLIMPGAAAALIFPDWTTLYPMFNFFNLHSYIWHALLVTFPLLLLTDRQIAPSIRHIHWNLLFLCCVIPPVYIFDKVFKCNYFFINWPPDDTPLALFAAYFGNPGYLIPYAALLFIVLVIVYIPFMLIHNDKKCPQ